MADSDAKKCPVSYEIHGDGPPLVLLRGLGRSVQHWLGYERTVMSRHFKVITLDLRGIGTSTMPCTWGTSIFDMAEDIATVLDALAIPAAHILGVSLGGMVTLAMGLAHPERCQSLIVVNTSIAGQLTPRLSATALRALGSAFVLKGEAFHARLVDALVGGDCPSDRRAEVTRAYAEIDGTAPPPVTTVLKQLVAAGRFFPARRLKSLKVPTLVVYGTDDRFVPNLNSRRLVQHLPDAKLVPIHGGGHELSLDKPEELASVVRDWVAEIEKRGGAPAASTRQGSQIARSRTEQHA